MPLQLPALLTHLVLLLCGVDRAPREAMMATAGGGQMGNGPQPNVQNQSLVDDPEIWGSNNY